MAAAGPQPDMTPDMQATVAATMNPGFQAGMNNVPAEYAANLVAALNQAGPASNAAAPAPSADGATPQTSPFLTVQREPGSWPPNPNKGVDAPTNPHPHMQQNRYMQLTA